jgi:23S rRNA (guanosine2251-2'-O)-methyltransferase
MKNNQLIYGVHPLLEALDAGKNLDKVMIQRGLNPETLQKLLAALKRSEIPFQFVPKARLDRETGKNHQGVLAFISPVEYQSLEWLIPAIYEKGEVPFILILDRITDVRNFGAICRTAECAGVHAVVVPSKGAAQINEDAIKTSAGAILRIPICRENSLKDSIVLLNESGLQTIACHEGGKRPYFKANLSEPIAIIMGSEEDGISKNIMESVSQSVSIPMQGKTDSLNVSVASAIVMFDALRQRSV